MCYSKKVSNIFRVFIASLLILFGITRGASVDAIASMPWSDESHQYTVIVREDGSAVVMLLVPIMTPDGKGTPYMLTLPEGVVGNLRAWSRQDSVDTCVSPMGIDTPAMEYPAEGIARDAMYLCRQGSIASWIEQTDIAQYGNSVTIPLPKTKQPLILGMRWEMGNLTKSSWWGRTISFRSSMVEHFVSYVSVALDVPDGVYLRDKSMGPARWGDMSSGITMSQQSAGMDAKTAFIPSMFDRIGGGDIVKSAQNLGPLEPYSFSVTSATSRWKLFILELTTMAAGVVAFIVVASLLLRLIVGKKPLWWYVSVVGLCAVLIGLIFWLIYMYRAVSFGQNEYPVIYKQEMSGAVDTMERTIPVQ